LKLSIAICTFNRADLLRHCLQSLVDQEDAGEEFEVLVIDNNSRDNTLDVTNEFLKKLKNLRIVHERNQGLSHARNRAIEEAAGEWVCYLDDDAKAHPTLLVESMKVINGKSYSCFGGVYLPWYKYGQPKWFKDAYASNKKPYNQPTALKGEQHLSGGIFYVKRELLIQLNGFSTDLGMSGKKVAYGEETELQLRIRNMGLDTVYIPDIKIDHLVPQYKLDVSWFLNGAKALGRDQVKMGMIKKNPISFIYELIIMVGLTTKDALWHSLKLLKPDYYLENWKIDVLRKGYKRLGMLKEIIS